MLPEELARHIDEIVEKHSNSLHASYRNTMREWSNQWWHEEFVRSMPKIRRALQREVERLGYRPGVVHTTLEHFDERVKRLRPEYRLIHDNLLRIPAGESLSRCATIALYDSKI